VGIPPVNPGPEKGNPWALNLSIGLYELMFENI
jgi:hypothetical protein